MRISSEDRVIAGYENSQIILWHWRRNEVFLLDFPPCFNSYMKYGTHAIDRP